MSSSGGQAQPGYPNTPPHSGTAFETVPGSGLTVTGSTNQLLSLVPFYCPLPVTVDRIAVEVTNVGSAGSVVRLGLYRAVPGDSSLALLLDAGTVPGDVVAIATVTPAPSLVIPAGWTWTAVCPQLATPTAPMLRTYSVPIPGWPLPSYLTPGANYLATPGQVMAVPAVSGVAGALPAVVGPTFTVGDAHRVLFRTA